MSYSVQTKFILRLFLFVFLKACTINGANDGKNVPLNIAIIGAGPAGLVSSKYAIAQGHNVTIYEQEEDLGGTWVFNALHFI